MSFDDAFPPGKRFFRHYASAMRDIFMYDKIRLIAEEKKHVETGGFTA